MGINRIMGINMMRHIMRKLTIEKYKRKNQKNCNIRNFFGSILVLGER